LGCSLCGRRRHCLHCCPRKPCLIRRPRVALHLTEADVAANRGNLPFRTSSFGKPRTARRFPIPKRPSSIPIQEKRGRRDIAGIPRAMFPKISMKLIAIAHLSAATERKVRKQLAKGGQVARHRNWHGPAHLKRAWVKRSTASDLSPS